MFRSASAGAGSREVTRTRAPRPAGSFTLDGTALAAFGSMRVPKHLWLAMQRFAVWIEPALMGEWTRLMQSYATGQGRRLEVGAMAAAMTWSDPDRDVTLPRTRAVALLDGGRTLHCVWSGKRLSADSLDVDHCLPWSAWSCGDLWNLVPADRRVNQNGKRDRLPSAGALEATGDAIAAWWSEAYLRPHDAVLPRRFAIEARASLPGLASEATPRPEDVQNAMALQRMRLRRDQGVPEWSWR